MYVHSIFILELNRTWDQRSAN